MTFDYLASAPISSDHSTYEGIHVWSGIMVECKHILYLRGTFHSHFFILQEIRISLHLKSPGNEEYDQMKEGSYSISVYIYTHHEESSWTATMFSTMDIVHSCSKSEQVWNFQSVITIILQGFWFPCMYDGFGKWIKEKNDAKQSTIDRLIVHQIQERFKHAVE